MTTLTFDIRPANRRDCAAVALVHEKSWENAYAGIIPHKSLANMVSRRGVDWWERTISGSNAVLVAEVGGQVAGYATVGRNRTLQLAQKGEIYELYVKPEYQGLGFGGQLFSAARARVANFGLKGTVVWALEENINALGFYRAMGGMDIAEGTESFENRVLKKIAFVWN